MISEESYGWRLESEYGRGVFGRSHNGQGVGQDVSLSNANRDRVFADIAQHAGMASPFEVVGMTQVHGSSVVLVEELAPAALPEADALVTSQRGVVLTGVTADCVPVVLMAEDGVGVIHAGWRGLAAGVVAHAVVELSQLTGARPDNLVAFVGPAASHCCYEVGDEVIEQIGESAVVSGSHLDSAGTAIRQLNQLGVERIEAVDVCTICSDSKVLNSFRRDGDNAGRQGVLAWLN